jgi:hypothetical protein
MCLTGFEVNPRTSLQLIFLLLMLVYEFGSYSCFYLSFKLLIANDGLQYCRYSC